MRTRWHVIARLVREFLGLAAAGVWLSSAALAATPGLAADDDTFSLDILHYPLLGTCDQVKASVGQRFTAITHLPVVKVDCFMHFTPPGGNWDATRDYALTIFYKAQVPVLVESTEATMSSQARGAYSSQRQCEGALPYQAQLFRNETGLEAAYAYCYDERAQTTTREWVMAVVGFGRAKSHFHRFVEDVGNDSPNENEQAVTQSLAGKLQAGGLHVAAVFFRQDIMGERTLNIYYYAPQTAGLMNWTLHFAEVGECESQTPSVLALFRGAGVEPAGIFCSEISFYQMNVLTFWSDKYSVEPLPLRYLSLAECMRDQPRILQKYQGQPDNDVEGGVCAGLHSYYQLNLFHILRR